MKDTDSPDKILLELIHEISSIRAGKTFAPSDYLEKPRKALQPYIDSKIIEAEMQGALNALTQLKADRIEHTLTTKSDEWTREIDFIDEHILALNHRKER